MPERDLDSVTPSENPGRGIEDTSEPEPTSESQVDDVTPSPDPGRGIGGSSGDGSTSTPAPDPEPETETLSERVDVGGVNVSEPQHDPFDRPDRRGPTERARQEFVADRVDGIEESDIANVTTDGVELTDSAREDRARDAFAERRERARQTADVDAVSRFGGFDVDELAFEATGDGVQVSPEPRATPVGGPGINRPPSPERTIEAEADPGPGESDDSGGLAGDGPIASTEIPGTDRTVGGVLDRSARTVDDAFGRAGRELGERGVPGRAGPQGSERGGDIGEFAGRGVGGVVNVPGFAQMGVRAADEVGRQLDPAGPGGPLMLSDPQRTGETAAATRQVGGEAAGFARENPVETGAFLAGTAAGGLGVAGLARAARGTPETPTSTQTPEPAPQPGTGGTGTLLDPSDVRQPASSPGGSGGGGIRSEIRTLLGDDRAQLGAGRQRQRPDRDGGSSEPTTGSPTTRDPTRELFEGSPRDRISSDITSRQRGDQVTGTFDGAGDPLAPTGSSRGTSPGSRVPRDPLDTTGGRTPTGADGIDLGLGGGAAGGGALSGADIESELRGDVGGGAGVTGAELTGLGEETTPQDDLAPGERTGMFEDLGIGSDGDQTGDPFGDTGLRERTGVMTTMRTDQLLGTRTPAQQRAAPRSDVSGGLRDPTPGSGGRPGRRASRGRPQRPRRIPTFDLDADTDDELLFDEETTDALIDTGIASPDELAGGFDAFDSDDLSRL